jgi:hypothetical protein
MYEFNSYYHSGFPNSFAAKYQVYAIYSSQLDCFLYVNHTLDTLRRVHYLMSSKIPTWVYTLRLPDEYEEGISNKNAECWTLQTTIFGKSNISKYQTNHNEMTILDCTMVNVLGQISGQIDLKSDPAPQEALELKNWAMFLGQMVEKIKITELPEEEIIHRISIAESIHTKSDISNDDLSYYISKIYKLLLISANVKDFKQRVKKEILDVEDSFSRINKMEQAPLLKELLLYNDSITD